MPNRLAALSALAALALATPALAAGAWVKADDMATLPVLNISADAADDLDVTGPGGTKIGEVDDVVGRSSSAPSALVVDFKDGSNYGDRDRVIPLDQFTMSNGMLTLNTKPEDVQKLDVHDD